MTSWLQTPGRAAAALDRLPDAVVAVDAAANVLWVSNAALEIGGYDRDALIGRSGLDLVDPRDMETAAAALLRTMESGGVKQPWPLRIVAGDGRAIWVEMLPTNLLDHPSINAILVAIRPLEGRYAAAAEARAIEELFRRAFEDAPIGMALMSPDYRLTRINGALCDLLGRSQLELLGIDAGSITHPDDLEVEGPLMDSVLAGERRSYQLEKRVLLPDGAIAWVLVGVSLVRADDGSPERFVVHVQDIHERKESEALLAYRATHDQLTRLPNRALFEDRLELALARSERVATSVAVLFCDLDGFKRVNDSFGHEAGDDVLVEVAGRLQGAVRAGDTVARFGGDEFVVLCEDVVAERELDALTDRMRRAVQRPVSLGGSDVCLGVSIGHAVSAGGETPAELVNQADAAMYAAKPPKPRS
jgi:diguanylate cyclase (GGDEF)-like protein/PAS domain S-box-containing protein